MNLKDTRILKKVRTGDKNAFESLFHQFYPSLCGYAESLTGKPEVAEEVVQDVFFNVWKNRNDLLISSSWKSYLFRSVFNNSMMYLRKNKREVPLEDSQANDLKASGNDTEEQLEASELNAMIVYTLSGMPERTREVFSLSRFEGLKYQEIAEKLSISIKTVESNMGKALKTLRETLEDFRKIA